MSKSRLSDSSKANLSEFISSSDDSDDDYSTTSYKKKEITLRIPGGVSDVNNSDANNKKNDTNNNFDIEDIDLSKYKLINNNEYINVSKNSKIIYIKNNGKKIQNKYFKKFDNISDSILIGFYTNDKRNYTEKLSNIKQLFIEIKGLNQDNKEDDMLKDAIEIEPIKWKNINRDTIISYQKKNDEWIYKAKFNAFVKSSKDQSIRMSMTTERGYSFVIKPDNIKKLYRHVSGNDKTLTFILHNLKLLEERFILIENNQKKLNMKLNHIEKLIKQ